MTLATSPANAIESLIAVSLLALVHLFVKLLDRLGSAARNALLSAGAGASLAYCLMRILPKLAEKQDSFIASADTGLRGFLEHHAYLAAMVGLVAYYGVSRVATYGAQGPNLTSPLRYHAAAAATVIGYCAYSVLIGYLIVNRLHLGLLSMGLIVFGMGALFLVTDYGLRKQRPEVYERRSKWLLAVSLLLGWVLGVLIEVSTNVVALWFAFLAGVMLISTIGEKMSMEQRGSFWPFLAGVTVFTALILLLEHLPQADF
ncbi:MAG: hypothetical protein QNJ67_08135 [Kiloniellales bacterium]|nr:hypothetical protein [Kiloniellales bacterium]